MLTAGTTLGTYEVIDLLGKDGTEKCIERETRLKRDVASRSFDKNSPEMPIEGVSSSCSYVECVRRYKMHPATFLDHHRHNSG
jgi:hypothetical protein